MKKMIIIFLFAILIGCSNNDSINIEEVSTNINSKINTKINEDTLMKLFVEQIYFDYKKLTIEDYESVKNSDNEMYFTEESGKRFSRNYDLNTGTIDEIEEKFGSKVYDVFYENHTFPISDEDPSTFIKYKAATLSVSYFEEFSIMKLTNNIEIDKYCNSEKINERYVCVKNKDSYKYGLIMRYDKNYEGDKLMKIGEAFKKIDLTKMY